MPRRPATYEMAEVAARLGDKVKVRREELELTQEELAERSGVSRNQIQNIEHSRNNIKDPATNLPGRGNPRLDTIFALAGALDLEISVLIDPDRPLPRT